MLLTGLTWAVSGALAIWLWLALFRGGFWRADQKLTAETDTPSRWPKIAAVIPARDEAPTMARAVRSIASQDYPAELCVVVVDDGSRDGTAHEARSVGETASIIDVVDGQTLPEDWTGKMWAVAQGIERVETLMPDAEFLLLTDADIEHAPGVLRRLVAKADRDRLDLVSLMVKLRLQSNWEKLLVPAFIFFFQKLFPFPWVNDPGRKVAAAAGGCMLVRREALSRIGGIARIRDRVIDDCALAAAIKPGRAIWLGLAEESRSLRGYDGLRGLWDMVARTAFVQLKNSYSLLLGTVAGMVLLYIVPLIATLVGLWFAAPLPFLIGFITWIIMTLLYLPTLKLYSEPTWRAFLLPVAALYYTAMTVDSAWRTFRGRGAGWKGRSYAPSSSNLKGQVGE